MNKTEALYMKVFLRQIRKQQEEQKEEGTRPWSMEYISVSLHSMNYEMTKELKDTFEHHFEQFGVKRAYAIAYKLREMGLVRVKKYNYHSTYIFLTEKGTEYVKELKKQSR